MDWKTFQNHTFQVLYSGISRDDLPPPLQRRSFTSDSYEAIKKRERKKNYRREQNKAVQRSSAWRKEDTGVSTGVAVVQEVVGMGSGPRNVVSATHLGGSKTEPLIIGDNGSIHEDYELQHRLSLPGVVCIGPHEDPPSGKIQHPAEPASPAISPQARVSDMDLEREICGNRVLDPRAASLDDVHMITGDGNDACTYDQQPYVGVRNEARLKAESPSYATPADGSAGGCFELSEQLIERSDRDTPPLDQASPEPKPAPEQADTTGLERLPSTLVADGALATALPDHPSHTVDLIRTIGWRTCRAGSEQAGSTDGKSNPQSVWTSGQDEQLLHLREIAQLNWRNITSYFPGISIDGIKGRYKHLSGSRVICKTVGAQAKPRVQMRQRTTYLTSSNSQKAAKKCRTRSKTESRKKSISVSSDHHATPFRGRVTKRTKRTKRTKHVASLEAATHEVKGQRTSRCGRPIRHPFRHRLSEGYV